MTNIPAPDDARPAQRRVVPCVIYAAKSTEDRRGSIPDQLKRCHEAITHEGGREIVAERHDEAASAYRGSRGPGLADARELAERLLAERGACELWVLHSDRLARGDGRTAAHLVEHVLWAIKSGVTLRSVEDDDACQDLLYAAVNGQRNHEDSKRKSAATRSGKRRRFESGKAVGGPINDGYRLVPERDANGHPFIGQDGRVSQRRVLDPERAPIVRRIFDLVDEGHTFGDVARLYNSEGLLTRTGRPWSTRTVREIVVNPYFAGWITLHDERRRGDQPPLIEPDRWEAIQAKLSRLDPATVQRRKGGRRPTAEFLLRQLAFCPKCGAPLYTRNDPRAYICRDKRQATGLCDARRVPADRLEAGVLSHLQDLMPGLQDWLAAKAAERTEERDRFAQMVEEEHRGARKARRLAEEILDHYRELLASGKRDLAETALAEHHRAAAEAGEQERDIKDAQARLDDWTIAPDAIDAALDYFTELRDHVRGTLNAPATIADTRAALSKAIAKVEAWMGPDDVVQARIVLRAPHDGEVPPDLWMLLYPPTENMGEAWPEFMRDELATELDETRSSKSHFGAGFRSRRSLSTSAPKWMLSPCLAGPELRASVGSRDSPREQRWSPREPPVSWSSRTGRRRRSDSLKRSDAAPMRVPASSPYSSRT